ncbi:hypothetical protein, partial [Lacticaseibacillus rhamnosus]|uniref:hypothetical protein n=1 Tax=Lacticaseibacillus rhamnosus TaxID=47715 RepID=UPI001CDC4CFB
DVLLSIETDDNGVASLVVNSALREANATATVLKQLLAALRLPDVEGLPAPVSGSEGCLSEVCGVGRIRRQGVEP